MKKFLFTALFCLALVGCSKNEEPSSPQEVNFTFGLQLPQYGSMTRSASDLYSDFYSNYIINKTLVPDDYNISIYQNDEKVGEFRGKWDADLITLPEGTYRIMGSSDGDFKTASLIFDENINITKNTTSIKLTAIYDCYMLFFNKEVFSEVEISCDSNVTIGASTSESFPKTENIFYIFLPHRNAKSISYKTINKDSGWFYLKNYNFEKGKYYMFDIVNGEIIVPQMSQGNE